MSDATWKSVIERRFERFDKFGGAGSVLVRYTCEADACFKEWVPVESDKGRLIAERWWKHHGGQAPAPATADEFLTRTAELKEVREIRVEPDGKFWRITGRRFATAGKLESGNLDFLS
jgi:DNA repair protein RadD